MGNNPPPSPTAVFTVLTGRSNLTKTITLGDDGRLHKTVVSVWGGSAETVKVPLSDLPRYLDARPNNDCIIHSDVKGGLAEKVRVEVLLK